GQDRSDQCCGKHEHTEPTTSVGGGAHEGETILTFPWCVKRHIKGEELLGFWWTGRRWDRASLRLAPWSLAQRADGAGGWDRRLAKTETCSIVRAVTDADDQGQILSAPLTIEYPFKRTTGP